MPDTSDQILALAEDQIRSRGFHAVSYRDLASELGIKSASVHYHFPQKQDLGIALVRRYRDSFFEALNERTSNLSKPDEFMAAFVGLYREALHGTGKICLCGMLGAEIEGLPSGVAQEVSGFLEENINWLAERLDPELDAESRRAKAACSVSTLHGAMLLAQSLGQFELFDTVAAKLSA